MLRAPTQVSWKRSVCAMANFHCEVAAHHPLPKTPCAARAPTDLSIYLSYLFRTGLLSKSIRPPILRTLVSPPTAALGMSVVPRLLGGVGRAALDRRLLGSVVGRAALDRTVRHPLLAQHAYQRLMVYQRLAALIGGASVARPQAKVKGLACQERAEQRGCTRR
jgi:hypothetical protein